MGDSSSDTYIHSDNDRGSKKRKKTGRMSTVMKVLRASTHERGPDCQCKRFQCFKVIPNSDKDMILRDYNEMGDHTKQSAHLSGLISVMPVTRRRNRCDEPTNRSAAFLYRVRVVDNDMIVDKHICRKNNNEAGPSSKVARRRKRRHTSNLINQTPSLQIPKEIVPEENIHDGMIPIHAA
ncbi:hypothetical protein JTB14_000212 [Gonioctena quinquepunctata]|nr:hypothetical protein JTB14_000212 [Gonioctena quinquepunctata]